MQDPKDKKIISRYFTIIVFMAVIGIIILIKALSVMMFERNYWRDVANRSIVDSVAIEPRRGNILSDDHLYMHGGNVFNFTADVVPDMVEKLLQKSELQHDDINLWVFHQANKYMINYLRKLLSIDKDKFYIFMEKVGNTVSSTIPIALCEARREDKLHGNVLLAGFGVGLSWGGVMLKVK